MKQDIQGRTIMFVGHAKLRQGTVSGTATDATVAVAVVVDRVHGVIIECDSSQALVGVRRFLERLIIGYSLLSDMEEISRIAHDRFVGLTAVAFVAALSDAQRQFVQWRQQHNVEGPLVTAHAPNTGRRASSHAYERATKE